jgi:hypothetical protein
MAVRAEIVEETLMNAIITPRQTASRLSHGRRDSSLCKGIVRELAD